MMGKKRPVCVLEFNHSNIRCCQSEVKRGQRVLAHCFSMPVQEDRDLALSLAAEFRRRYFKPSHPIIVLPRHMASWQSLRLPSQDEAEIRQMLQCHVSRQSAFSGLGSVFDYHRNGQDREGNSLIQVCSFPRQRLKSYFETLDSLGLDPSLVTLNVQGLLQWMLLENNTAMPDSFCLLSREGDCFDLSVISGGRLSFSRSFVSSFIFEQTPSLLLRELKVSLETCRRLGLAVAENRLYVAGKLNAFEREFFLHQDLEIIPAASDLGRLGPSLDSLSLDERLSFLACLGLALNPPENALDMRPPECKQAIREKRISRIWFKTAVYSCALVCGLWCLLSVFILRQAEETMKLRKAWIEMVPLYKEIERQAYVVWIRDKVLSPDLAGFFSDLYGLDFSGTKLVEIKFHASSGISIKGRAKGVESAFLFLQSLKSLPAFQNARIDVLSEEKTGDSSWPVSFHIRGS
ncbi:MAG: hypothetical protein WC732_02575 [Candidatus Omnitrophota bacterium]